MDSRSTWRRGEIRSRAFSDPKVLQELASHFGESWWQEVGLLLLALEDPSLFVPYMREVVKQPTFPLFPSLVELYLDDAAETSGQPFAELLALPGGSDPGLLRRQLLALQVLARLDVDAVEKLKATLAQHPSAEIRRWFAERAAQKAREWSLTILIISGYQLVKIPGGLFMMGSAVTEVGRYKNEGPLHEVRVPDFYMGRFPVTNEEYERFLLENPDVVEPQYWADRPFNQPRQPVVGVSWDEARRYAEWAGLRLPSEAEWEYACRAGTNTPYYTGDSEADLGRAGWYAGNSNDQLHPVGEKEPNRYGLYDMHGNVMEWVEDDWHGNYKGVPNGGRPWVDSPRGSRRVYRGGGWLRDAAARCRSAYRNSGRPVIRYSFLGFRLARSITP